MLRVPVAAASIVVTLGLLCPTVTCAQDKKADAMRDQVRRMQQAQKKSEAERASLVQEKDTLAKEKLAAEGALKKSAAENAGIRRALSLAREEHESLRQEAETSRMQFAQQGEQLAVVQKRLADTETALRSTEQRLALSETERAGVVAALGRQRESTLSCEAKNTRLYVYGRELLERYQSKGFWSSLAQKEPFTGIKSVEIENLLEEYREKLDEQKLSSNGIGMPPP